MNSVPRVWVAGHLARIVAIALVSHLFSERACAADSQVNPPPSLARIMETAKTAGLHTALVDLDRLLADLPPNQRMISWQGKLPTGIAPDSPSWLVGNRLIVPGARGPVMQFDARTGRRLADLGQPARRGVLDGVCCVAPADAEGREVLLLFQDSVERIDLDTGKPLNNVTAKFDKRIAPIACPGGFVAVGGYRAKQFVRMTWDGKQVWEAALPGYVMSHAAAHGDTLVVQTRGDSYGGQATSAISMETGQTLWSEKTDAYGMGVAFEDNGKFVVEADQRLSIDGTMGWLICREPRSGKILWKHEQPGGTSCRPIVDLEQGHIFTVFDPSSLMCFDGRSGKIIWTATLPAPAAQADANSYFPQRQMLRLTGEGTRKCLVCVDRRGEAYFLDPATGAFKSVFPIVSTDEAPSPYGVTGPTAAPWVIGDQLVVATMKHVAAYSTDGILAPDGPPELLARALRVMLLLKANRVDDARSQLQALQAARPNAPEVLQLQADVCGPGSPLEDPQAELAGRLQLLRRTGQEADPRLARQFGLLRRISIGPMPTEPLLVGDSLYVGSRAGKVVRFNADTLQQLARYDAGVAVVSNLTFFDNSGGFVVFATDNRHTVILDKDLKLHLDLPSRNNTEYYVMGNTLVRSWPCIPHTQLTLLDCKTGQFGRDVEVKRSPFTGYVHAGRLYFLRPGGGTVSYDGATATDHPALLKPADFGVQPEQAELYVNPVGTPPVAFGPGGVFAIDEHLRASRKILASDIRVHGATANNGALVVLREPSQGAISWLLEAWSADGSRKLPLHYETRRYVHYHNGLPILMPFGKGVLLVGRELVYVEPDKAQPVWRFDPGSSRYSDSPTFRQPVVRGQTLMVTHQDGDLFIFDVRKITAP